jgi:hypothetical protein
VRALNLRTLSPRDNSERIPCSCRVRCVYARKEEKRPFRICLVPSYLRDSAQDKKSIQRQRDKGGGVCRGISRTMLLREIGYNKQLTTNRATNDGNH